jgi:PTS system nitrogen regulatory IIA component
MNGLSDIVSPDSVEVRLSTANKKALLQHLAASGARLTGQPAKKILAALSEREKSASTGFGTGTAIPHAKLDGLENVFGYFVRLSTPVDYGSVDGLPVDLVFLLLSPPDSGAEHLKALAIVSRAFRDRQLLAKLRGARSKDALYAVLTGEEERHAA